MPSEVDTLSYDKRIQYEYLHKHYFHINGIETNIECGVDLGKHLYKEIIDNNGNLDDETLIELFKYAFSDLKERCKPKVKEKSDDK